MVGKLRRAGVGNTEAYVSHVKGMVDAKPRGRSLASRLTETGLLTLMVDGGKFVPPDLEFRGSQELEEAIVSLEKNLLANQVSLSPTRDRKFRDEIKAVLDAPGTRELLAMVRDSNHDQRHWAYIGLAGTLNKLHAAPEAEFDRNGRRKLTPIRQYSNHCTSACGLMALQKLTGMDLPPELQSYLAGLSSRQAARGIDGANAGTLYPLVGLDVTVVNYMEELQSRRSEERKRFSESVLKERIIPELRKGKLVVLSIQSSPLNHAILLSGVSEDGNIEVIDPAGAQMRDTPVDLVAKRWYIPERESLSAVIINFPTLPDPVPAEPPLRLFLDIPPVTKADLLPKAAIGKEVPSVEGLNAELVSFRWVDMTSANKDGKDPEDLSGVPLAIQLQLIAGRPVAMVDRKGQGVLVTGYTGGLGKEDVVFRVESGDGREETSRKDLLRALTVKNSKGNKTLFVGYLATERSPFPLVLE